MRFAIALTLLCLGAASRTRAQYVPPPYLAPQGSAQTMVPPYPAPAPDRFPSAVAFLHYSSWRLGQLAARERALGILGRTDEYRTRKIGALLVMGVGASMFAGGYGYFFLSQGESDSDDSDARQEKIAAGVLGLGLGVTLGGLIWLYVEKHKQPYRAEIKELQHEQAVWRKEQHRARRQARLQLSANGLQLKF